ncbi:MAG: UDP-N-acetylmuramate--L-alanine ligase [Candidatus Zixiibacteriota bacterium]
MFGKIKKLYFVGIGGAGMSGIAEILHNLDYEIAGSDSTPTEITEYLSKLGVKVHNSHQPDNLGDSQVVVISSAVGEDNAEVMEARRRGLPVIKRAEMLGELMRLKYSIGIAGTHGKTTTTSMIGRILQQGNYQPTLIVGGVVAELGTGAALGTGDYLVAEADEYDKSFLSMYPSMAVVTNMEPDHLDCYDGEDDLYHSFVAYMNRVPFYGVVIIPADDKNITRFRDQIARPYFTFGLADESDYRAANIKKEPGRTTFTVLRKNELLGELILRVPGQHNVMNALAATAATTELEVPFTTVSDALMAFKGVGRRFEIIGQANGITVIDDYAHHPTEIAATLKTAKENYKGRIIVIYQPHLFSRTRDFLNQFAESLSIADKTLMVDIYPAREKPIEGVTSKAIVDVAAKKSLGDFEYLGPKENAPTKVVEIARPGDVIITMGAGSVTLLKLKILELLKKK